MKVITKIHKTYNYLIRAAIFAATYFFLYRQVFHKRNLAEAYDTFQDFIQSPLFRQGMLLLLLLMLLNWGLETVKWKLLIARIEKMGFLKAFRAVLAGVSVSIFLPNRSGEFLGRVFILEKANRVEGALITIIGSVGQMIITASMGLFGFLAFYYQYLMKGSVLHDYIGAGLILMVPVAVFSLLLLYFNMQVITPLASRLLKGRWAKYARYAEVFSLYKTRELFHVLLISFFRYIVFSTQYFIFLHLFGINIPFLHAFVLISVIYLVMMMVPSIALTEIGIRGSISIYLFSLYLQKAGVFPGDHHLGIFAASSMLWLMNIVLPAIAGSFFVFNLKFFRK